MISDNYQRVIQ